MSTESKPNRPPPRKEHPAVRCNLALIGGRGSGKSSISKRLARRNRGFMLFSIDALVRYEAGGITIPQIVEREGWSGFREREYEVIAKASAFDHGALIDCGGGSIVDLDERGAEVFSQRKADALHRHGMLVYLRRDTDYLIERIAGDTERPSLSELSSFTEIMERRDPWYRRAADHVVDCDGMTKREITEAVLDWFYDAQQRVG